MHRLWGEGRDVLQHTVPLLQVAFKIHDPMDGDHLVPSEPEQQVTWWVLTAQPLETPYCAWAAEAGSEQACRIGFTASLPRPSDVLRPSVQHAWPFPGETAMSATGAVPSQQPTPRPQTLCAGCPERLPSPKDDIRGSIVSSRSCLVSATSGCAKGAGERDVKCCPSRGKRNRVDERGREGHSRRGLHIIASPPVTRTGSG